MSCPICGYEYTDRTFEVIPVWGDGLPTDWRQKFISKIHCPVCGIGKTVILLDDNTVWVGQDKHGREPEWQKIDFKYGERKFNELLKWRRRVMSYKFIFR